jgi:16S rRNA C967 or C1407 C5-methylase (RsmB/RsmF family)
MHAGHLRGSFMLQNLPSVAAALALAPTPGSRVIDLCAAPGGKSTLLAQLMGDRGAVIAADRSHSKVRATRVAWAALGFGVVGGEWDRAAAVAACDFHGRGPTHAARPWLPPRLRWMTSAPWLRS